jgi:hypothetical protein
MLKYQPGNVLEVKCGLVCHFGIASDGLVDGQQGVISNSKKHGRVAEESVDDFSGGQPISDRGYWSELSRAEVLARARNSPTDYWVLFDNCEHFVRRVHGMKPRSPQLAWGATVGAVVLFGIFVLTNRRA